MRQTVDKLMGQLHGVTGPEGPMSPPPASPWPWIAGAIAVILATFLIWRWWRRPARLLPPDREAERSLRRQRPTAIEINRIARRYMQRRYNPQAFALTPAELSTWVPRRWAELLGKLDVLRFRPAQPSESELSEMVTLIESLIRAEQANAAGPVSE